MQLRISIISLLMISLCSFVAHAKHVAIPYGDTIIYLDDGIPVGARSFPKKPAKKKAPSSADQENEDQVELDKLGTEPVSAHHEQFIRNIQHELGLDDIHLTIRKMNDDAIALVGRENAFVIGGYDYLFVSEEWFNELTLPERRFLIGHELSHLMMQHSEKKEMATAAMTLMADYLIKYIGNNAQEGTWKHYGIEAAKKVGFGTVKLLLLSMLSRGCESEADEIAAQKLNSAQGGIALFERMDKKHRSSAEETSWFLIMVRKLTNCFASHPSHGDRVRFLQSIADKNQIAQTDRIKRSVPTRSRASK